MNVHEARAPDWDRSVDSRAAGRSRHRASGAVVVYEDAHLLVVDKPPGLSTVPGRSGPESLITTLRESGRPGARELRLVQRLDKDTSGVVVVARTLEAQRALSEQFSRAAVHKVYLALVTGRPDDERGTTNAAISIRTDGSGLVCIDPQRGKPAITDWEVIETFRGFSLLRCQPRTGRTHQVRIHLAHAGCPLAVDPQYGGGQRLVLSEIKTGYRPSRRHPERPLLARLSLHADTITFGHPATAKQVTFRAAPPNDLAVTIKQLRKYAS